jgi:hypothetical protein
MVRYARLSMMIGTAFLAGCAKTTALSPYRFSPPQVDINTQGKTLENAQAIVQNFVTSYSKAQKENADARQIFELPSLIAVIGGIAATAFGGGPDGVLVAGTASATLRGGNAYYAPKAKAQIFGDGLDALNCIGQVAVGAKPYELRSAALIAASDGKTNESLAFDVILNGVRAVEQRITGRLSNAGSFADASGIAAEYEKSIRAEMEAKDAGKAKAAFAASMEPNTESRALAERDAALAELTQLQEKVQQCILRAKG